MTLRARLASLALVLVSATGLVVFAADGQQAPGSRAALQSAALTESIPADPQISMGVFPNGLHYYVRANRKPDKRAELRLVVRAGSVLEADDQQGLAHFVEHMAFNGTTHFPKNKITSFIESLGMRFGADVNASTGFDETTYILTVPTDKPETMDQALLILEDWAHNVTFDPAEIDSERGVVMEEWRMRRGASARMQDKEFPILLKGSRYADRIPIGKTDIIQTFKPARLTSFYADWYRPDLMAVVAVGDFDRTAVEIMVKNHFASIPAARSPKPRPAFEIPDHAGVVYAINSDKEATTSSVEIDNLLPARHEGTLGDYRQKMVDAIFAGMINARFSEMAQKPDTPFMAAGASRGSFPGRSKDSASLFAQVKEGSFEPGLDAVLGEVERVARFGFTATELDRQKAALLRVYERLAAEESTRVSASRADEYVRNFLTHESLPTTADEFVIEQRFLADITLADVSRPAKDWYPNTDRLIVVNAPDKAGVVLPTEAKLAAAIMAVPGHDFKPYVDAVSSAALLDVVPTPGTITKTTANVAAGLIEWELSNGAKVVLKPTRFKQDEILFGATSPGGTSLASDADYIPATTSVAAVASGGVGKMSSVELRKALTGKVASVTPVMSEVAEGMSGTSSRQDLETMFQLIYLRFTEPRADPGIFSVLVAQQKQLLANQSVIPEFALVEALSNIMGQGHPRRGMMTAAKMDEWNLDRSMAFYKDRFADASDFTFVFVGTIDEATMRPLVERYLASLPALHRQETWKDVGARLPTGVIDKRVEKGIEPKSQAMLVFNGPFAYNQTERVAIRAMSEILQMRLLETIREELGGTYSINVGQNYQRIPVAEYSVTIQFGCDPQRTDALVARVFEEVEKLKSNGPTEKQLNDEREALLKEFDTRISSNAYLIGQILGKYQNNEDPATLWAVPDYYRKIDAAMIQQAARTYLNSNSRVKITLFPEKK